MALDPTPPEPFDQARLDEALAEHEALEQGLQELVVRYEYEDQNRADVKGLLAVTAGYMGRIERVEAKAGMLDVLAPILEQLYPLVRQKAMALWFSAASRRFVPEVPDVLVVEPTPEEVREWEDWLAEDQMAALQKGPPQAKRQTLDDEGRKRWAQEHLPLRYRSDGREVDADALTRSDVGDQWSNDMEIEAAAVQKRIRERRLRAQDVFALSDAQPACLILRGDRHGNLLDEAQHGKKGLQVLKPDLSRQFDAGSLGRALTRVERDYAERRTDWSKSPEDWARPAGEG